MLKVCGVTTVSHCWTGHACVAKSRYRGRNPRTYSALDQPANDTQGRSAAALGAVELPHGVLWWHNKQHSVYQHDVLRGQDFILQRQRSGGPGLVLSQRISSMQIVDKVERERVQLEMHKANRDDAGAQLVLSDMFTFDLTDYVLVEESAADSAADNNGHPQFPPTACTGIVVRDQPDHSAQRVKYTCKLCGTTSMKAVNPHAWASGTVFGRCDGCQVIHKLTDNLELFHELSGSLFESSPDLNSIVIPKGLPQKPYMP